MYRKGRSRADILDISAVLTPLNKVIFEALVLMILNPQFPMKDSHDLHKETIEDMLGEGKQHDEDGLKRRTFP
jgi:hypothetical protein